MATVAHPVFPDQKKLVPDGDVKSWTDMGWTKVSGKEALPEGSNLTSFEEALEAKKTDEPVVVDATSWQPNTTTEEEVS